MALFMMLSGLGSWLAALILAREGYQLALTGEKPSCDINPFFSCGSVMQSWQATLFFDTPNQLYGIGGYAAVALIGASISGVMSLGLILHAMVNPTPLA